MRVEEILAGDKPCFSFEFFPPKSDDATARLYETVERLKELAPAFVSVTYGAGGGTRARTIEVVKRIKNHMGIEAMAHFTCSGHTRDELHRILGEMAGEGIENVLALRGDPPQGQAEFRPAPDGLAHASDLIELISETYDFSVGGACYPEVHPEAAGPEADLAALETKVASGARFLITQLFFDNDHFFDFVERARARGIEVPILPGVMPIASYDQVNRFTSMCGAVIPGPLRRELEARRDDPVAVADLGVSYATLQCADLLARGAPGIHFYTLNRSPATRAILAALKALPTIE